MSQELTTKNSQELINQAKSLSGNTGGSYVPYIPIITINNKTEEKEAEIDGVLTKVEVPAKEGFNITLKNEDTNEYNVEYYEKELEEVILRVRYSISSKNKVKPRYYSYEFDNFSDNITVYDENKTKLIEDTYANVKKFFATGELNSLGKPVASFDLQIILYIDINDEIYRFKLNNASRSNFFDYMKLFGNNDIFTAYKTKFNLKFNDNGTIKFWYAEFEKGEQVDLTKEIILQKELKEYFDFSKAIKQPTADTFQPTEVIQSEIVEEESKEDEISVDQIPF